MKKLLCALLSSCIFTGGIFAQVVDNPIEEEFVVGTTSGYAPYVSLNAKGEYEGFDIDIAEALAKKLGRKLVLKDGGSMPGLMISLQQGRVDALIWAVSITEERQKKMEMVYYQGEKELEMPFLFWGKIPEGIGSIAALCADSKKAVSVEAGTYQEDVLNKFSPKNLKYSDKITDAILELKYGKSVAVAVDPPLIARFQSQYPEIKVLRLPLPVEEQSLGNGICLSKSNAALAKEIRAAIAEMAADGTIAQFEKKWNLGS